MTVREELQLDLTKALASVTVLDRKLSGTANQFSSEIARGVGQLNAIKIGGVESTASGLTKIGPEADKAGASLGGYQRKVVETAEAEKAANVVHHDSSLAFGSIGVAMGIAVAGLTAGVLAASSLETALAPVGTLLGATSVQAKALTAGLKDVIAASPQSAEEIGLSAYTILSAGVKGTANVLEDLRASQKLSEAGLGTLADATGIVTSAINSFNKEGLTAQKAAELFFGTIAAGKTTTAGLAQGFGSIAPLAASTGVRFRELLSATAALTATGQEASVAYAGLRGILTNILQPASTAADAAKRLGIDFSAAHLQSVGLAKFLEEVTTAAGGNTQALSDLFGSVEGLNAVLALTGPQAKAFADNLENIDKSGAKLDDRAKEIEATFNNRLKTAFNNAKVTAAETFTPFLGEIGHVLTGLTAVASGFGELPGPAKTASAAVTTLSLGAFSAFIAFQRFSPIVERARNALQGIDGIAGIAARGLAGLALATGALTVGAASFQAVGSSTEGTATGLLGLAGAGAVLGAQLGTLAGGNTLLGAAIGGTAGTVIGLVKAFNGGGESADDFAKRIANLSNDLSSLGNNAAVHTFLANLGTDLSDLRRSFIDVADGVGSAQKQIGEFGLGSRFDFNSTFSNADIARDKIAKFEREFSALARVSPGNAQKVLESLKGMIPPDEFTKLEGIITKSADALKKHETNARSAAVATALLTGDTKTLAAAYDDELKSLNAVNDALLSRFDKMFAAMHADEAARDALDELNKVQRDGTKTDEDRARQLTATEEAFIHAAAAAGTAAEADHKAEGAAAAHKAGVEAQRAELEKLAGTLDPASPLRVFLQQYIDKLDAVPAEVRTTATFDSAAADAALSSFLARFGLVSVNDPLFLDALLGIIPGVTSRQSGGPVIGTPGQAVPIVAHGGEFVLSADIVKRIKEGRQTEGASTSVGSGNGADQSINIASMTVIAPTPRQAGLATVRRLRAFQLTG